jgi:hypothetical protein
MPNGVKYSTTTPSGSLRRDNVALGVNGNLGPTANTGFYSMPAPQSGKYIINKVAASGLPNFFAPQNDTELIQLARNEGATGANTGSAAAVLAWIATQPNLEAANFEYESIVTDGLVLNLDAGFVGSYPTTSSAWYDLSGNTNNGTLTNGPTFNSVNSGSIVLDGVDDYVNVSCATNTIRAYNSSTEFVVKLPSYSGGQRCILSYRSAGTMYIGKASGGIFVYYNTLNAPAYIVGSITNGSIAHCVVTCDATNDTLSTYINGTLAGSVSRTGWSTTYNSTLGLGFDLDGGTNEYMEGNFYLFRHYNKVLSQSEILQNYNAQRTRFGL